MARSAATPTPVIDTRVNAPLETATATRRPAEVRPMGAGDRPGSDLLGAATTDSCLITGSEPAEAIGGGVAIVHDAMRKDVTTCGLLRKSATERASIRRPYSGIRKVPIPSPPWTSFCRRAASHVERGGIHRRLPRVAGGPGLPGSGRWCRRRGFTRRHPGARAGLGDRIRLTVVDNPATDPIGGLWLAAALATEAEVLVRADAHTDVRPRLRPPIRRGARRRPGRCRGRTDGPQRPIRRSDRRWPG
jgi:hypothetical protein